METMRTILLAAAAAILATFSHASAASRAELAGSEIRRSASLAPWMRYEVLHLKADGSFEGNYESARPIRHGEVRRSGDLQGRWTLHDGELCLEGRNLAHPGRNCYRLKKGGYSKNQWSGLNTRTGDVWQFFLYPRGR